MEVAVGIEGHIEVEHDIDLLDINAASEKLRRHKDTVAELLEALVDLESKVPPK